MAEEEAVTLARRTALFDRLAFIPVFTGEDTHIAFRDFIDQVNGMASYLKWDKEDKYFFIRNRLGGRAAQVIRNFGAVVKDCETLERVLTARFGRERDPAVLMQEFLNFKQHSMPVDEFIARAQTMSHGVVRAQGLTGVAAESSRLTLLKSMLLTNLRQEIKAGVIPREPVDIAEIEKFARLQEKALTGTGAPTGSESREPQVVCAVGPSQEAGERRRAAASSELENIPGSVAYLLKVTERLEAKIGQVQEQLSACRVMQSDQTTHEPRAGPRCFACGGLGHFARQCPNAQDHFYRAAAAGSREHEPQGSRGYSSQRGRGQAQRRVDSGEFGYAAYPQGQDNHFHRGFGTQEPSRRPSERGRFTRGARRPDSGRGYGGRGESRRY